MKKLFLADLKDMNEKQLKSHIASEYGEDKPYDDRYDKQGNKKKDKTVEAYLKNCKFMIAYESVGSWGCDSCSWFLFKKGSKLYEVHGSHCSCYGFEGQWKPEETTVKYLQSDKFTFYNGGYDDEKEAILDYVNGMRRGRKNDKD